MRGKAVQTLCVTALSKEAGLNVRPDAERLGEIPTRSVGTIKNMREIRVDVSVQGVSETRFLAICKQISVV